MYLDQYWTTNPMEIAVGGTAVVRNLRPLLPVDGIVAVGMADRAVSEFSARLAEARPDRQH